MASFKGFGLIVFGAGLILLVFFGIMLSREEANTEHIIEPISFEPKPKAKATFAKLKPETYNLQPKRDHTAAGTDPPHQQDKNTQHPFSDTPATIAATVTQDAQTGPKEPLQTGPKEPQTVHSPAPFAGDEKSKPNANGVGGWLGDRISYEFTGPIDSKAELSLKTGLEVASKITFKGKFYDAYIIEIVGEHQDVFLHLSIRPGPGRLVSNEQSGGVWGTEITAPIPFKKDVEHTLVIFVRADGYAVLVDDNEILVYPLSHDFHGAMTISLRPETSNPAPGVAITHVSVTDVPTKRIIVRDLIKGVVNSAKKQESLSLDRHVKLFIGVMSQPANVVNRFAIRNAWMLDPAVIDGKVAVRFFVGPDGDEAHDKIINDEIEAYNDIVKSPYAEGYYRIANKTRYILEIATASIKTDFVMKCDDDTYVRIDRILPELEKFKPDGLYWGTISSNGSPIRDPNSKWYLSPADWPESHFPPFAHGPGYILSNNLAQHIIDAFKNNELKVLTLEDVSMATWVEHVRKSKGLILNIKNDHRFNIGSCNTRDLIGHYISPNRMVCMFGRATANRLDWCC